MHGPATGFKDGRNQTCYTHVPTKLAPEAGAIPAVPLVDPEIQALAILERASLKMAERTTPGQAAEPASPSADGGAASPTAAPRPPVETQPVEDRKSAIEGVPADIMKLAEAMKPAQDMARDLKPAEPSDPFEPTDPVESTKPPLQFTLVEQFDPMTIVSPAIPAAPAQPQMDAKIEAKIALPAIHPMYDNHFRLALTGQQSLVLAVVVFALVIGAFGMAAYGWVAAHDWSCRQGLLATCPPSEVPIPLLLPEIPS